LQEHSDGALVAIAGVLENVALVGELVDLVVQPLDHLPWIIVVECATGLFGRVGPIITLGNAHTKLVRREQSLVPETGKLLVELGQHLAEELLGSKPVWLVQRGVTYALSLSPVNVPIDGRLLAAWAT